MFKGNLLGRFIAEFEDYILVLFFLSFFLLYNFIYKYIIGFNYEPILYYSIIPASILGFFVTADLIQFFKQMNYISFLKRLFCILTLGVLIVEFFYLPYLMKVLSMAESQVVESKLNIDGVYQGRVGRSGIYYIFNGQKHYIGMSDSKITQIQSGGKSNYCFYLTTAKSIDGLYIIKSYKIERCKLE